MRAESCLRKPGDAAQRESDGAVAVWQMHRPGLLEIAVFTEKGVEWCNAYDLHKLGDDWQPLDTAERVEELVREVERLRIDKGKTLSQNAVLENRVTGLRSKRNYLKRNLDAARAQIATLTAELEKARIREACKPNPWSSRVCERGTKGCIIKHATTAPLVTAEPTPAPANPEWLAKVRRKLESIDGILGGAKASIADAARELDYLKSELSAALKD